MALLKAYLKNQQNKQVLGEEKQFLGRKETRKKTNIA